MRSPNRSEYESHFNAQTLRILKLHESESHCRCSIREYHQVKIDFILTVRVLLSNLWDTSRQAWGCSKPCCWRCCTAPDLIVGDTEQASADLQKNVSLGGYVDKDCRPWG